MGEDPEDLGEGRLGGRAERGAKLEWRELE